MCCRRKFCIVESTTFSRTNQAQLVNQILVATSLEPAEHWAKSINKSTQRPTQMVL